MNWSTIISGSALIISIFSIVYTYYRNKRKLEVDLWIDNENNDLVTACAYNPSFRSISLIYFNYAINGNLINIKDGTYPVDPSIYGVGAYSTRFEEEIKFPYILTEGEAVFITLKASNLAGTLHYNDYQNEHKLSVQFKTAEKKFATAEKKIYESKAIDFDIEKYRLN